MAGWFLAFSTCSWNALSEPALHQRCEAVGVDAAKQGVWKQPVYKAHLDKGQLGGTSQNRGAPRGKMRATAMLKGNINLSKLCCFQEF